MNIQFESKLTVGQIENQLSSCFHESNKSDRVAFDLSKVEWAGLYPCALLYNWAKHLHRNKIHVSLRMPEHARGSSQLWKVWYGTGFAKNLKMLGIIGETVAFKYPEDGTSLGTISNKNEITKHTESIIKVFEKLVTQKELLNYAQNVFSIAFPEIVENGLEHSGATDVYYAASIAYAHGKQIRTEQSLYRKQGTMVVFDQGTPYIEIVIGDMGKGINSTIAKHVPADYIPSYPGCEKFSKNETALVYAFEPFSTSNAEKRKERISQILNDEAGRFQNVATGLYYSLQTAKESCGQIITRTPKACINFDCYTVNGKILLSNNANRFGEESRTRAKIANLPGTHFLIRIPLMPSVQSIIIKTNISSDKINIDDVKVVCIDPFKHLSSSDTISSDIAASIADFHNVSRSCNSSHCVCIVLPPPCPLTPRAIALFVESLKMLSSNYSMIIWAFGAAKSIYSEPVRSSNLHSTPILVGSISENLFALFGNQNSFSQYVLVEKMPLTFSFREGAYAKIAEKYCNAIKLQLYNTITCDNICDSDGPFLIEGVYYTKKFYKICQALKTSTFSSCLAEWVYLSLPEDLDLIITAYSVLSTVLKKVQYLYTCNGKSVDVIEFNYPANPPEIWYKTQEYVGKNVAVLSTVICRANQICTLFKHIDRLRIQVLLCVVDARDNPTTTSISLYFNDAAYTYRFRSIVKDKIQAFDDFPLKGTQRQKLSYDKLKIIDSATGLPTTYTRPIIPGITVKDLLFNYISNASTIMYGHHEHSDKHYTFYLNFQLLFSAMSKQLEDWFDGQVNYFKFQPPNNHLTTVSHTQQWHIIAYNPDNSLIYLLQHLNTTTNHTVELVTDDLLSAPPITKDKKSKCIALLPAISSGHTASRLIEYASRYRPENILLLAIVSRMNADRMNFMTGIDVYRSASFSIACHISFPISSFFDRSSLCPVCDQQKELVSILHLLEKDGNRFEGLIDVVKNRLNLLEVKNISVEYLQQSDMTPVSAHTLDMVYLRTLLEISGTDIEARKEINNFLSDNFDDRAFAFLELFRFERCSDMFKIQTLKRILYKTYNQLVAFATAIANGSNKVAMDFYIDSLIALVPDVLLSNASRIINLYCESFEDIQAICYGYLVLGVGPSDLSSQIIEISGNQSIADSKGLIIELKSYYDSVNSVTDYSAVSGLATLYASLSRSSHVDHAISGFNIALDNRSPLSVLKQRAKDVINAITMDRIFELQQDIRKQKSAAKLFDMHSEIPRYFMSLDKNASILNSHIENIRMPSNTVILYSINQIERTIRDLISCLERLIISPVHCDLFKKDYSHLETGISRKKIHVSQEVDYYCDKIVCDLAQLNKIEVEVIKNLLEHGENCTEDLIVNFKLSQSDTHVIIEVIDNIPGEINKASLGGTRIVSDVCSAYGGSLKIVDFCPEKRLKSMELRFPRVSRLNHFAGGSHA